MTQTSSGKTQGSLNIINVKKTLKACSIRVKQGVLDVTYNTSSFSYFLLLSEIIREMKAKEMPTMQTPSQSAWVHTYPAQNVPSEPPMK